MLNSNSALINKLTLGRVDKTVTRVKSFIKSVPSDRITRANFSMVMSFLPQFMAMKTVKQKSSSIRPTNLGASLGRQY